MTPFPRDEYLGRVGLASAPAASEDGLLALHRAQACTIPFENIEPFLGRPVPLGLEDFRQKILLRQRGGYCFELNCLFGFALEHFGFEARRTLGRVFMGRPQAGGRTHYVNLVKLGSREWLADVGFGGPGLRDPIPFEAGYEGEQQGRKIRLRLDADWGMTLEDYNGESWRVLYVLPNEKVVDPDVIAGNHVCATHADSLFRKNLFGARTTMEGRVSVWNRELYVHDASGRRDSIMRTAADLAHMFRDLLQITVSDEDVNTIHAKLPIHP